MKIDNISNGIYFTIFTIGILLGILVTFYILYVDGDNTDLISTKELGKVVCSQYNLSYDHREIITQNQQPIPKIYCKDGKETKLNDGIVVKVG